MSEKVKELNLYQKIVEVRKVAGSFAKDSKGHNYQYVSGNQVLSKIKDKMNELNLLLIPATKVGEHSEHNYKTFKGKEMVDIIVQGEMTYTWINGDKPEEQLVIDWAYYGQQDDISKAFGSALTYSERYFLLKCLGLPTDADDPDSRDTSGKTSTSSSLSDAQVKRLYAIGYSKGLDANKINNQVMTKYKKKVEELSKTEYDTVCKGYKGMEGQ